MKSYMIILVLVSMILMMGMSSADLGTFKQGDCVQIKTILNTTAVNISTISNPNSSIVISNQEMTKNAFTFNYSFCNTSILGLYVYDYFDVEGNTYVNSFSITPSGSSINSGSSLTLFGSLLVIFIFAIILLILGFKVQNKVGKIALFSFSGVGFMITVLYMVITIQQILYGFDSIVSGIENFWFIVKILIWIGLLVLGVIIFLIMLKAWKIKRGYDDED